VTEEEVDYIITKIKRACRDVQVQWAMGNMKKAAEAANVIQGMAFDLKKMLSSD
jgi:hypothetical protein